MKDHDDLMSQIDPTDEAFSTLAQLLAMMRMSAYIFSIYAMTQGLLIILGGPGRFSSESYSVAMFVPYAPAIWGWILLICGVFSFIGIKNRKYIMAFRAMFSAGVWSMAFGIAFLVSSIQYPKANLTAFTTYSKDAVLFILIALALRLMARTQSHLETPDARP